MKRYSSRYEDRPSYDKEFSPGQHWLNQRMKNKKRKALQKVKANEVRKHNEVINRQNKLRNKQSFS